MAAAAALGGCALGPAYRRPGLDVPAAFAASPAGAAAAWPAPGWWSLFGSPELDGLIARARAYNTDLAAAAARVLQADAQVRIAGAPLLPAVSGTGNQTYQRIGTGRNSSSGFSSGGGSNYLDSRTYSAGLSASYEFDFWGKNRATLEAAQATAIGTRFDQETVALTAISSVATTYFAVLAGQDRVRVAERNLREAERILQAFQARLSAGTASALDVSQQETLVASQRAELPGLRNTTEQNRIGLGILVGTAPEALDVRGGTLDRLQIPEVGPGLPAELLLRRPDVATAEASLLAANANIRAARAAFFPDITLTASGGLESAALSALTGPGTLVARLATAVAQPIFDNGLRRGELEQAKGREQELVADYVRAVLQSLTDVEQALVAKRYYAEQESLSREAVRVAQRSSDIATVQLQVGTIDIVTALNTQTALFTQLDSLVQIRLARFQNLVGLFRALGGGWSSPGLGSLPPRSLVQ